jgi:hypothetical protein|tara:strand:+ start:1534 stop:1767 length:234 start_codon:yes stop_codon:yes gene_type:complete
MKNNVIHAYFGPKSGDTVEYLGCTKEQINWGNNDYPYMCIIGRKYKVVNIEVHSQHTKLRLEGIEGWFNSVCFQKHS